MTTLLVVLAVAAAALGGLMLSEATTGVGVVAGACLLAIFARMAQARADHASLITEIWRTTNPTRAEEAPGSAGREAPPKSKARIVHGIVVDEGL